MSGRSPETWISTSVTLAFWASSDRLTSIATVSGAPPPVSSAAKAFEAIPMICSLPSATFDWVMVAPPKTSLVHETRPSVTARPVASVITPPSTRMPRRAATSLVWLDDAKNTAETSPDSMMDCSASTLGSVT